MQCHYEENGISVISWNDNGPVIVISNVHSDLPHTTVKRWNPSEKCYINIDRPNFITVYNKHMGGVDLLDAHVSVYRIDVHKDSRRFEKCCFQSFSPNLSWWQNGFFSFYPPNRNVLSKSSKSSKAAATKYNLSSQKIVERKCCCGCK